MLRLVCCCRRRQEHKSECGDWSDRSALVVRLVGVEVALENGREMRSRVGKWRKREGEERMVEFRVFKGVLWVTVTGSN